MSPEKFSNGELPLSKQLSPCANDESDDFLKGGNPTPNTVNTEASNPVENGNYLEDVKTLTATELKEKYPLTYDSWKNMKQRCKKGYILDQRFEKFSEFLTLMGPRCESKYTLDRIDPNNPNYGPDHCRWANKYTQNQNKGNNVFLTYNGETLPVSTWAARTGQKADTLYHRKAKGWSDEEVITGVRKTDSAGEKRISVRSLNTHELKERTEGHRGWVSAQYLELEAVYDRDGPDAVPPPDMMDELKRRQEQYFLLLREMQRRNPAYTPISRFS